MRTLLWKLLLFAIVLHMGVVDAQSRRCASARPSPPKNGRVSFGTGFKTATFRCNVGFRLFGTSSMTCRRQWQGTKPVCVKSGCPPMIAKATRDVPGGSVLRSARGAVLIFHCHPGYTLHGESDVVVCDGRHWNATKPSCEPDRNTSSPVERECKLRHPKSLEQCGWTSHGFIATPGRDPGQGFILKANESTSDLFSPVLNASYSVDSCFTLRYRTKDGTQDGDLRVVQIYGTERKEVAPSEDDLMEESTGDRWQGKVYYLVPMVENFQILVEAQRDHVEIDDLRLLEGASCPGTQITTEDSTAFRESDDMNEQSATTTAMEAHNASAILENEMSIRLHSVPITRNGTSWTAPSASTQPISTSTVSMTTSFPAIGATNGSTQISRDKGPARTTRTPGVEAVSEVGLALRTTASTQRVASRTATWTSASAGTTPRFHPLINKDPPEHGIEATPSTTQRTHMTRMAPLITGTENSTFISAITQPTTEPTKFHKSSNNTTFNPNRPTPLYPNRPTITKLYPPRPNVTTFYPNRPTRVYPYRSTNSTLYPTRPSATTAYPNRSTRSTVYPSRLTTKKDPHFFNNKSSYVRFTKVTQSATRLTTTHVSRSSQLLTTPSSTAVQTHPKPSTAVSSNTRGMSTASGSSRSPTRMHAQTSRQRTTTPVTAESVTTELTSHHPSNTSSVLKDAPEVAHVRSSTVWVLSSATGIFLGVVVTVWLFRRRGSKNFSTQDDSCTLAAADDLGLQYFPTTHFRQSTRSSIGQRRRDEFTDIPLEPTHLERPAEDQPPIREEKKSKLKEIESLSKNTLSKTKDVVTAWKIRNTRGSTESDTQQFICDEYLDFTLQEPS